MTDTLARMRQLIGSPAEWNANDIVLGYGEIGIERVSASEYRAKAGDGTTKWSGLPYLTASANTVNSATQAALDGKLAIAGGTMTGPLILSGSATAALGAVTKSQLDAVASSASSALAGKFDKAGGALSGPLTLPSDPTSPLHAVTKQYVDAEDVKKVDISGDVMTGALVLYADPAAPMEAATKRYVDEGSYQTVVGGSSTYAGKVVKLNAMGLIDNSLVSMAATYLGTVNPTVPYSLTGTYLPGNYFSIQVTGTIDATWANKLNGGPTTCSAGQFLIYNGNGRFDLVGESSNAINLDAKLDKAGGTMTGPLVLAADPTAPLGAATKQYADTMVPKAGGTMTGLLVLSADPSAALGAATKQYVDGKIGSVTGFVAKAGDTMTGPLTLSGDATAALHPVTKQQAESIDSANRTAWAAADTAITTAYQAAVGNRVNKAGDTMTGALTLPGNPTTGLHAATKQYVDGLDTSNRSAWAAADSAITSAYQAAVSAKVAKAGDTMTGNLEIQNVSNPGYTAHWPGVVWWKFGSGGDGAGYIINNANRYMWMCNGADVYTQGNVVAYWSDARLKEEVRDLDGYEARIMGLRPVSFAWNDKGRAISGKAEGEREVGFIAQEARGISESYVAENPTAKDDDGNPYLTVKKDEMIADLVALVQSLTKRVRELEEKLA